jgi:ADP-ribose pyrophosphatase
MVSSVEHTIARGKYLSLLRRANWEYAKRLNSRGVVIIAALTENHELILVEQYRVPLSNYCIEMPAGLVGDGLDTQEDLLTAAKRELLEETGYEASHFEVIISGPSSPGLTSEIYTLLFASQLKKTAAGGGIGDENIKIHVVPVSTAYLWLKEQSKNNKLVDPKILAALYYISSSN